MTKQTVARKFFEEHNAQEFRDYRQLEKAVLQFFQKHLADLPPEYKPGHLLELGERKGWIVPAKGRKFQVRFEPDNATRITAKLGGATGPHR